MIKRENTNRLPICQGNGGTERSRERENWEEKRGSYELLKRRPHHLELKDIFRCFF